MKALLLLFVLAGCEREHRVFELGGPQARPLTAPPFVSTVAGPPPAGNGQPMEPPKIPYVETAQAISEGKVLYRYFNCVGCHANGGGAMGPAFIDERWIYGSRPEDVATSIISGRPEGMPSFRNRLTPTQVGQLAAYVRSLGGLARGDAVPARQDHIQVLPPQTLQNTGVPLPSQETP